MVPKHGITYFLGDMGLCSYGLLKTVIDQLNGIKILVRGNHDGNIYSCYNAGFDVVIDKAQITIGKNIITMTHCPLKGVFREDMSRLPGKKGEHWHKESRHGDLYSIEDFGQFHLSGHIHSPNDNKSQRILGRQLDVGVVANGYKPVTLSQVESWVNITLPKVNNWVDIPDYSDYKINEIGEIKSFKRYKNGIYKSPYMDKDGYLCVSLRKDGKSKGEKVHRLVAKTFIENPNNLPQVNHKNGHKLDVSKDNLEWCDNLHNQRHAWNNDLKTVKLKTQDVKEIKLLIKQGMTNVEISKKFNVDPSTVSNIRTSRIWKDIKIGEIDE